MKSLRGMFATITVVFMAGVSVMVSAHATEPSEPVVLKGHTDAVWTVTWAADAKSLATAGNDRTIRVWDPAIGRQTASVQEIARVGYGGPVVAFSSDLRTAAINYWGEITILAVADGKALGKIDPILDRGQRSSFRSDVFAMALSPNGKRLATAGSRAAVGGAHGLPGGIVIVWDVETGAIIHQFDRLSTAASSIVWSPDGKVVVAGTSGAGGELQESGEVWVWDAETGMPLHTFPVKPQTEYGEWASAADVAISPDGQRVAVPVTAGSRGAPAGIILKNAGASVRVWHLGTGKGTQPVKGFQAAVGRVVFSPDGKSLATAGGDKVIRLWEVESGKELASMPSPAEITVVAFSPDGLSLAGGCKDGSVRIWRLPPAE